MSPVDPSATLGALVAERPARASLFERLRLEYCCGGRQTLAEACNKRGLEIDSVRARRSKRSTRRASSRRASRT